LEKPILIAHNGSGFDNWLLMTEENIEERIVGFICEEFRAAGFIPHKILKTTQGIIDITITNKYTSLQNQELFKRQFAEKKGIKDVSKITGDFYQKITFRCSMQHLRQSLKKLGESFKIPKNLRKLELDHDGITLKNYAEKQEECQPYLKKDLISHGCVILKYSKIMMDLVGQNMSSCITSSSLTLKGWYNHYMNENPENKIHTHTDKYIRWFIRKSVFGGRVFATRKEFRSQLWRNIRKILIEYRSAGTKHTKMKKAIASLMKWYREEIMKPAIDVLEKESGISDSDNEKELEKLLEWCYNKAEHTILQNENVSRFLEIRNKIKALPKMDDDFLMAFDATSLYPSAMWDSASEFPDSTSARAFMAEEEQEILDLFNSQKFRPRTGFFRIKYHYPPDNFLQHLPVKENIRRPCRDTYHSKPYDKTYEVSRFRNGYAEAHLSSVDIQEIVRTGGKIIQIYEGIVYERNLPESPLRSFIDRLFKMRQTYPKGTVGNELIKLLMNSLYGKTVQRDIEFVVHIWSECTLKQNYDDLLMSYCKIQGDKYIVTRKKEKKAVDVSKEELKDGILQSSKKDKKSRDVPLHLGSFILAHSKRIMNNFILAIDGYKNPNVYYSDTDSLYISKKFFDQLMAKGLVGNDLCKGKNDYGEGGIIFGLYLAPKIKYNIVLSDGVLLEKQTFKGCNRGKVKSKDFFKLATGEIVEKEIGKSWQKDFVNGVRKTDPKHNKDDLLTKRFTHDVNILKRKGPDEAGIMYPYYVTNYSIPKNKKLVVDLCDGYDEEFWERIIREDTLIIYDKEKEYPEEVDEDIEYLIARAEPEVPLDKTKIYETCTHCKTMKPISDFHNLHWCKACMIGNHNKWLAENPNARKAQKYRRLLYDAINNTTEVDTEHLTGLPQNKLKEWMDFTKQHFIPKDYMGRIDIEHLYPLSKYDMFNIEQVKHCLSWKHLRYCTRKSNMKKASRMPTEKEKETQLKIVNAWLVV
jgi:hypothetical protein